jgi:serine/threonine protein phosphatase PrpC
MSGSLRLATAARSHVGRVRALNEDSFLARPELGLWAVADGMGGHAHGDHASRLIAERLAALTPAAEAPALLRAVERTLADCHAELRGYAGPGALCGSTVVVLLIHGPHFALLWAGDSRAYRLRDGRLELLTQDHSWVREMIDAGRMAPETARLHPWRNRITRAVGIGPRLDLDAVQGPVAAGDLFLLCTDGLTNELEEAEIAATLTAHPIEEAGERLLALALGHGARDNVTFVLVHAAEDLDTTRPQRQQGR